MDLSTGEKSNAKARARRARPVTLAAIERTSLGTQAAKAIKALIISGELRPGDALPSERDLAAMLGISRPSLREAIRSLGAANVLEVRQGGGTYVTSLDPRLLAQPIDFLLQIDEESLHHLFEVRKVLEVGAARLAAASISDNQLDDLERLSSAAERVLSSPSRFLRLDLDIHTAITEATGNPIFMRLYQSIVDLSVESRKRTARVAATRRKAHNDHVAIIAALRSRSPDAAAQAMQEHLMAVESSLTVALRPKRGTASVNHDGRRGRTKTGAQHAPRDAAGSFDEFPIESGPK